MCTMSMVMDRFADRFPQDRIMVQGPREFVMPPTQFVPARGSNFRPGQFPRPRAKRPDLTELRTLIDEFKAAVAVAAAIDWMTQQPDCVDAEKGKLIDRVREIEARVAALERETGIGA